MTESQKKRKPVSNILKEIKMIPDAIEGALGVGELITAAESINPEGIVDVVDELAEIATDIPGI